MCQERIFKFPYVLNQTGASNVTEEYYKDSQFVVFFNRLFSTILSGFILLFQVRLMIIVTCIILISGKFQIKSRLHRVWVLFTVEYSVSLVSIWSIETGQFYHCGFVQRQSYTACDDNEHDSDKNSSWYFWLGHCRSTLCRISHVYARQGCRRWWCWTLHHHIGCGVSCAVCGFREVV